jgi:glyoxylase-like metal-dependent hydrolase (beta-lactamase superfamily II)
MISPNMPFGFLHICGNMPGSKHYASYRDYIDSLKFMISLQPEIICLGHGWVLTHEDAAVFLKRSLAEIFLPFFYCEVMDFLIS